MITYIDAADAAIKANDGQIIHTAWDFGSFYLFSTAPRSIPRSQKYETGTIFTAVDKKTGRVYDYDITEDVDAYLNATVLKV